MVGAEVTAMLDRIATAVAKTPSMVFASRESPCSGDFWRHSELPTGSGIGGDDLSQDGLLHGLGLGY